MIMEHDYQADLQQSEVAEAGEELAVELTDLDELLESEGSAFTRRFTVLSRLIVRTYRRRGKLTSAACIVLALLLLFCSITPARLPFLWAPGPTYSLHLDADPPWGRLSVDGRAVNLKSPQAFQQFSVTGGQHRLTWLAAPFTAQQCDITLPVGSGIDTCDHSNFVQKSQADPRTFITFAVNLTQLPAAQRAALVRAAQHALDDRQIVETVRAGELYALNSEAPVAHPRSCTLLRVAVLCFATAQRTLRSSLAMRLVTSTSFADGCLPGTGVCVEHGQNCHFFCDASTYGFTRNAAELTRWQPLVDVRVDWQFTTQSGRVLATNEADSFILGMQNEYMLQLNVGWNAQRWDVSLSRSGDSGTGNDPLCDAAYGDMYDVLFASPPPASAAHLVGEAATTSGCLMKLSLQAGPHTKRTTSAVPSSPAYVLQRFGVLLAVNTSAHQLWPFLPVAGEFARQVARHLMDGGG